MIALYCLNALISSKSTQVSTPLADWPLELKGGRVYVKVDLFRNSGTKMFLDTGALRSVISRRLLPNTPTVENESVQVMIVGNGMTLDLSPRIYSKSRDRKTFARGSHYAEGILGIDAFAGRRVGLDLTSKRLTFYPGTAPIESILGTYFGVRTILCMSSTEYAFQTVDVEIEGTPVSLVPDTGAQSTAVALSVASTIKFKSKAQDVWVGIPDVSTEDVAEKLYPSENLKIMDILLKNRKVATSAAIPLKGGVLGFSELISLRLLWDLPGKRLYIASSE